jgi:hypothetical protein
MINGASEVTTVPHDRWNDFSPQLWLIISVIKLVMALDV